MFESGKTYRFEMTSPLEGGYQSFSGTVIRATAHRIEVRLSDGVIKIFNTAASTFISAALVR